MFQSNNNHWFKILLVSFFISLFSPLGLASEDGLTSPEDKKHAYLKVSLNEATQQELSKKLSGIGSAKAKAIIAYRENRGGFKTVDELLNVKGIGEKTLEKNRSRISL